MAAATHLLLALIVLVAVAPQLTWQISLPTDPTYNAAVVEFAPAPGTGKTKVRENLKKMKQIIESDLTNDLDILVFPEYVLNDGNWRTYVPDPALHIAPCDIPDYDNFLVELSCAARSRRIYMLINIVEKEYCGNSTRGQCNESGVKQYNTNVVFDRQGRVISRYRKTHLYRYEWDDTSVMPEPQLATFTTDFGVTFGHFICFDMLYWRPAEVLIKEMGITDIIYPTYWFSELPFLTSVQLQEGWAYANDVNLLAADANKPLGQNTGSGIYAGKLGRLTAVIHEEPKTVVLRAKVPKRSQRDIYQLPPVVQPAFVPQLETRRFTKLSLLRDYNVDVFTTRLLADDFVQATETVCHGSDFCCQFNVRRTLISNSNLHSAYRYRLAAFSGDQATHQRISPSALSVCAVIACTNAELHSCGHIFPEGVMVGNKYYFSAINVSASFRPAPQRLIMPSSVDALIMPLPVSMYDMTEVQRNNNTDVSIALTSPKADILTFGIWGNYYYPGDSTHNLDPPQLHHATGAATLVNTAPLLVLLTTLLVSCWNF